MVVLRRLLVLLSSFTLLSFALIPPSESPSSHLLWASSVFLSVFFRRNPASPSLKGGKTDHDAKLYLLVIQHETQISSLVSERLKTAGFVI